MFEDNNGGCRDQGDFMLKARLFVVLAAAALMTAQSRVQLSEISPSLRFGENCSVDFKEIAVTVSSANIPDLGTVNVQSRWMVLLVFQSGSQLLARPVKVREVKSLRANRKDVYPITGQLVLTLDEIVTGLPLHILVNLDLLGGTVKEWQPTENTRRFVSKCASATSDSAQPPVPAAPQAAPSTPAPSEPGPGTRLGPCDYSKLGFFKPKKGEENMSLTGAWVAGFSTRPLYTIDAIAELPLCPTQKYDVFLGGTIKTAERRSLDPDSFTSYLSFRPKSASHYGGSTTWYRNWDVRGGAEFSRKDQYENVVVAPKFVSGFADFKVDARGRLVFSGGFEFTASLEVGANRRTSAFRSGYGAIGRAAPAVTAYFLIPLGSPSKSFVLTSTYNPRVLLSAEPFTDNRVWVAHEIPFRSFAAGTRHYWLNQIDIDLTKIAALTFKNEFGSLPPAFRIIDFRFTTGLTLKWKWRNE